jgi:hypothetical protein
LQFESIEMPIRKLADAIGAATAQTSAANKTATAFTLSRAFT